MSNILFINAAIIFQQLFSQFRCCSNQQIKNGKLQKIKQLSLSLILPRRVLQEGRVWKGKIDENTKGNQVWMVENKKSKSLYVMKIMSKAKQLIYLMLILCLKIIRGINYWIDKLHPNIYQEMIKWFQQPMKIVPTKLIQKVYQVQDNSIQAQFGGYSFNGSNNNNFKPQSTNVSVPAILSKKAN